MLHIYREEDRLMARERRKRAILTAVEAVAAFVAALVMAAFIYLFWAVTPPQSSIEAELVELGLD